jgi:hypothetical protein
MPSAKRAVNPRSIAAVRRLYEHTTAPVTDLAAMLGISRMTFYRRCKEWGWTLRSERVPKHEPPHAPDEIERVEEGAPPGRSEPAVDKAALARGMYANVKTGMDLVAQIMADAGAGQPDVAEDASRMLASLARTLQEIARFEQGAGIQRRQDDNDRGPADPDEFARLLHQRLREFIARRRA